MLVKQEPTIPNSAWPSRLAVLLVCATFPLIWVGGLVTTYDAGMAVPDWPSTYGYNMFLYPWQTWLFGPWDLLIEHGHRLLAALVGILTIALVAAVYYWDQRRWIQGAALGALLLVILQGAVGGARVVLDERLLAMIHGCLGPAFFAYCVALAVVTSRRWRKRVRMSQIGQEAASRASQLQRMAFVTAMLSYLQLVIGAQLRHISVYSSPVVFQVAIFFHLVFAVVLVLHLCQMLTVIIRWFRAVDALRRPAILLGSVILMQLMLGAGAWVLKYGWPAFMSQFQFAASHTVQAGSVVQSLVVTLHVAIGSLILGLAVMLYARSRRLLPAPSAAVGSGVIVMELAS